MEQWDGGLWPSRGAEWGPIFGQHHSSSRCSSRRCGRSRGNSEQADQQQTSQQHDTAAAGAVELVDEGGEVYMKYDAPAYEDMDVEEDGEETELMPPKEIEEEEVGREVKEELAGLKNQLAPEVVPELERVCMKRWRVLSNKIGGVSDFEFKLKVEGGGTEGVLPTVPSATR